MGSLVLYRNGIPIAESDSMVELMEIIDKDISIDEATYEISSKEDE